MQVYLNGQYLPEGEAFISPADRGFVFADGVYEVIHAYDGFLFCNDLHANRLARSMSELRIEPPADFDMAAIAAELIRANGLQSGEATVYIQVTRGAAPRGHAFPASGTQPTVYGFAKPFESPAELRKIGCKAVTAPDERWLRCDIKSVSLLPNVMAKQNAVDAGAYETVLVREGNVTEGSSSNFAAIFDNEWVTAPLGNLILPGITREIVLKLCEKLSIRVAENFIPSDSLGGAEEAMILSSTMEVMPVTEIDGKSVGNGTPGPHTRRIQEAFQQWIQQDRAFQA